MSTTTALGVVSDKRPVTLAEFRNGHGWSPSIWNRLVKENYGFDGYVLMGEGEKHLDNLWRSIDGLPEWQQVPLVLTFDTGVIPFNAYEWAADMLTEFERRCPSRPDHVNHVPAMADLLRSGPEVPLFGVYGTSVSENPLEPRTYHEDDECDAPNEHGWCDGHGSGIPLSAMYVLPQHREFVKNTA